MTSTAVLESYFWPKVIKFLILILAINVEVNISVIFFAKESILVKNLIVYIVEMCCKILPPWDVIVKVSLNTGSRK